MKKIFEQIKGFFSVKKINEFRKARPVTFLILAVVIAGIAYSAYGAIFSTKAETRYVLGTVSKGTIVASVSGSGQVSTSNTISIKPKVSGEIVWVGVKPGDTVRQGQALLAVDNSDAKKAVVNAEQSLAASKLQLQHDTAAAPIDFQNAQNNLNNAQTDLANDYTDTHNTLSTAFLDMPNVTTGMKNILYGTDLSQNGSQADVDVLLNIFQNDNQAAVAPFAQTAKNDYGTARTNYDASLLKYQAITWSSTNADLETMLTTGIQTLTAVAQALQSELNFLAKVQDVATINNMHIPSAVTTMQTNARNYLATTNNDLNALLAEKKTLDSAKQAIISAQNTITLLKVGNDDGANPISLQIEKNNITTAEQNLTQLRQNLADCTVFAPFDGTIANVTAVRGDTTGATVATIVTNQKIAQLSLNEVDAAKIALGDKATLTFDAIDTLTLTGEVAEIDAVGTVSQGVVSYTVKINFDSQDERIKSGMTVNAAIQTATKQDVLMVPTSAVKTSNGVTTVLVFTPALTETGGTQGVASAKPPQSVEVETGLSDDTNVEIVSGLSEGEQIVTRTITAGAKTTAATATTNGRAGGFGGGAGIRIP